MPVNFELDFIQPLLLDLQTGNFKSVDDYAKAIAKYYQNTIAKGVPQGIPPTLPSPTAQGAPAPVSVGPGDAYAINFSSPSHIRMEKVVVGYYKAKDAKISKETLDYYKGSLERLIQDYKKAKEVVENLVPLILKLKEDVKQLPQKLDELVQGVVIIYESYKKDLDKVINNGIEINEEEREQVLASFRKTYKDEADLMLFIKQGDFSNVDQILATVTRFRTYVRRQEQKGTNTNDIVKNRFLGLLRDMVVDFINITSPEGFESVLVRFIDNKKSIKQGERDIITKAQSAVQFIKMIRFFIEPEYARLKKEYELKKENVKARFEQKIDDKKKLISSAIQEQVEKFSKKESEKVKGFKQKIEDVKRFKDEQYEKIKDEVQLVKDATSIIQNSVNLVVSVDEIYKKTEAQVLDIKTQIESLEIQPINKEKITNAKVEYDKLKQDKDFREYLNTQEVGKEVIAILEPTIQKSVTDFINIRNIIEKTDSSYTTLFIRLKSVEEDADKLITKFNAIQTSAQSYRNKRRAGKGKEPIKTRVKSTKKSNKKLKKSVLDVFKFIKRLKAKIERFIAKIQKWIKSQIKKKQEWIDKQATKIEIAILNSLPKSIVQESIETKKEAAEEKARLIELYKKRIETLTKKAAVLAVLAKSGAKLTANATAKDEEGRSRPDLSAASNEKPLRDFSKNFFEFKTINVEPNSPNYKRWIDWKKDFDRNINRFILVDVLLGVGVVLKKELEKPKGSLFKEKLKADFNKIQTAEIGLNKTNYGKIANIFSTFIESPSNDPKQLNQTVKEIQTTLKGQTLKKFISSANVIAVLIGIEREYLQKTRKHLSQLAAITSNANKLDSEINRDQQPIEKQTAKRRKLSAFDAKIIKLDKAAKGQGSFIVELIDLIDKESKELTQWLVKKKKELLKEVNEDFVKEREKVEDWFKKKGEQLKDKFIKNDLIPQSATYNIATNLFWTGATWVNNVGTTFQTLPIGFFKPLRVDGKLDGVESSVRELARNLENQLMQVKGLVIPNPATGIIPFTFVGYK